MSYYYAFTDINVKFYSVEKKAKKGKNDLKNIPSRGPEEKASHNLDNVTHLGNS